MATMFLAMRTAGSGTTAIMPPMRATTRKRKWSIGIHTDEVKVTEVDMSDGDFEPDGWSAVDDHGAHGEKGNAGCAAVMIVIFIVAIVSSIAGC